MANVIWRPQPGPQSDLLQCQTFEAFYGGARGGGKTDGMLGDWAAHAGRHGKNSRGVFFRRQWTDLEDVIERSKDIYEPLGARYYGGNASEWRFPNGALLRFRHLKDTKDANKYQGHNYCVAVGTLIRMGDGSLVPIEEVQVGDRVMTLEGPRPVTETLEPYEAECVEASVDGADGEFRGVKVHPVDHPILSTAVADGLSWLSSLSGRDVGVALYAPGGSTSKYPHPYTGEERDLSAGFEVGSVSVRPCGSRRVTDLTVEYANHYIGEHGLVNKNTRVYFEELTHWPESGPVDLLRATLRSAAGVPVALRATGNPGGAGHNWVKARYIDPHPPGNKILTDPGSGLRRVFIPARLEDNRLLTENDPTYESRLMASGSPELVKAWRWGLWDVVAGGFFDHIWHPDKQMLRPFPIPAGWRFRRSFDWGSAKPSSLGIWAMPNGEVLPDDCPHYPGRLFPRGSLIRIGEWYTVRRDDAGQVLPNEGLGLTNDALGRGIVDRSEGRQFSGCVADPSIWREDGGKSIYKQMRDGARKAGGSLNFYKADNSRIAGWKLMSAMLEEAAKETPESPGMWVFETCTEFVRTVPILQRDQRDPDDIDTEAEDHVGDESRYAAMSTARGAGKEQELLM